MIFLSNIYVPIDSSEINDIIPEGEDIIYSTFFRAEVSLFATKQWGGHLLMTNKGVYLNVPVDLTKKEQKREETFVPWYNIMDPKNRLLTLTGIEGLNAELSFTLTILSDSNRESEESYVDRIAKFSYFVNQIRIPIREKKAEELYKMFEENPKYKLKYYRSDYGVMSSKLFSIVKKNSKKGYPPITNVI